MSEPSPTPPPARHETVTVRTLVRIGLGVMGTIGVIEVLIRSTSAISLTLAALLIALALDHAVHALVNRGLRRSLAVAVVVLALLGLVVGIGFILVPAALFQGRALVQELPVLLRRAHYSPYFHRLDEQLNLISRLQELSRSSEGVISGAAKPVLSAVGSVLSFFAAMVTVFFLAVFMLVFGGRLIHGVLEELVVARVEVYESLIGKIYDSIVGYLTGLLFICAVNASLTTAFLAINRIPFFLALGIVSGLSSTVPYAGPLVAASCISLLSFVTGGLWHGIASIIYFSVYGQLEGNVLAPLVFRHTIRVNPLVVALSVLFLGDIASVPGAIVAVPAVAVVQIVVREILALRRKRLS
jgi:predicted PurR-regulated permease PerM